MRRSGSNWTGFARLVGPVNYVLEADFGDSVGWDDQLKAFHRDLWRGEYDADMAKLAYVLPSNLDVRGLSARLRDLFKPMSRVLMQMQARTFGVDVAPPPPPAADDTQEGRQPVHDGVVGDITASMGADEMSPAQKSKLAQQLNADAKLKRDDEMMDSLENMAAGILRQRLTVFDSVESAKGYMERTHGGIQARCVLIDVTMPQSRQTGAQSRNLCRPPNKELQKQWAGQVKVIPATPVVGHVLLRPALHSVDELLTQLAVTHSHNRTLTVPVMVPEELMRLDF